MVSMDAQDIFNRHLPQKLVVKGASDCYAPSNIALSKYWGKRDKALNLPLNSSLSISLREWGSRTHIAPAQDGKDRIWLNDEELPLEGQFTKKLLAYLDHFRREQTLPLHIHTVNSIPTAAGLASSASGFAALTLAIDELFGLDLPKSLLSMFARMGSGSASRSLWHGFVKWDKGSLQDGSDSIAHCLEADWPDFRIAILAVDTGPKSQSSRDGMNHTAETSPLYTSWPSVAEADCKVIERAIMEKEFTLLGQTAEANALAMHATMMAARPALVYLQPQSWQLLDQVRMARQDGQEIYATMDAGANIKLLFLGSEENHVRHIFPQAQIIAPFVPL